jgi:succinate-semialdehyde dehydrogenase/glutarate-semialdehyde dehydrogenase
MTSAAEKIHTYKNNDLQLALELAKKSQKHWAKTSVNERINILKDIKTYLVENKDLIAETIARDTGKNVVDAMVSEVVPCIMAVSYYLKNAKKFLKDEKLRSGNILFINKRSKLTKIPFGVVAIFSPWNYPFAIPFSEVIMAILAGNAVLLKAAHETPNVADILDKAINAANLPDNLFYSIKTEPAEASGFLLENRIDKFFFTGSPEVGKLLMSQASKNLIPVCLELGGNDPMIVLKDADLNKAASGAVWAGFQNCGQTCAGVERVYVDISVFDEFAKLIKEKIGELKIGSNLNKDSEIGLMTTKRQVETVKNQIDDAIKKGAKILAQAEYNGEENERIIPPTALIDVNNNMDIMINETFGPVICLMPFNDKDEVIELANNTCYGLTASIWTTDIFNIDEFAKRIEAGAITINDHLVSHGLAETPWGGFKTSSIGRSHGKVGFDEMSQTQVIVNDINIYSKKNLFWYPYSTKLYNGLKGAADLLYAKGILKKLKGGFDVLRIFPRIFKY